MSSGEGRSPVVGKADVINKLDSNLRRKTITRHDGWTEARKITFLATLRQTGCVRDAARVTGMSSTSAYRLRKQDMKFRGAWAAALSDARRGLIAVAHERAVVGKETVIIRNGKEVERRISPSDSMLALLIKQGVLSEDGKFSLDKVLTLDEYKEGIRFDADGAKMLPRSRDDIRKRLDDKISLMRERLLARRARTGWREVEIHTGEGFTPEVVEAARKYGGEYNVDASESVPRLEAPKG